MMNLFSIFFPQRKIWRCDNSQFLVYTDKRKFRERLNAVTEYLRRILTPSRYQTGNYAQYHSPANLAATCPSSPR